jgi:hypothetical protein
MTATTGGKSGTAIDVLISLTGETSMSGDVLDDVLN